MPLPEPLGNLRLVEPDRDVLAALYDELEFRGWRRELDEGGTPLLPSIRRPFGGPGTEHSPRRSRR